MVSSRRPTGSSPSRIRKQLVHRVGNQRGPAQAGPLCFVGRWLGAVVSGPQPGYVGWVGTAGGECADSQSRLDPTQGGLCDRTRFPGRWSPRGRSCRALGRARSRSLSRLLAAAGVAPFRAEVALQLDHQRRHRGVRPPLEDPIRDDSTTQASRSTIQYVSTPASW
jgi:hypothetical protein